LIDASGSASLTHTLIRYSGGGMYGQSPESILNNGGLTLNQTTIDYSGDVGLRVIGGTLNVQSSTFAHSAAGLLLGVTSSPASIQNSTFTANSIGLQFAGTLPPGITNCIIESNTTWGLYNSTGITISAINNWWGSASGPMHLSNPTGTGDKVSDRVGFIPFLTIRP
jgi:hypothetical protein